MTMTIIIIVLVLALAFALGINLAYQHGLAVKTNEIIVKSFHELQDGENTFKWLLDNTKTTDYLAWEELYDKCRENGIEDFITLDDAGKMTIRGVLVDNLQGIK